MFLSTSSFIVCGFMLILEAPIRFITSSFSFVTVSGLPASTVYSATLCTGKFSATADIISSSCSAVTDVGVPPPMYIVSSFKESFFAISAVSLNSSHKRAIYCGISLRACSTECETKEQ